MKFLDEELNCHCLMVIMRNINRVIRDKILLPKNSLSFNSRFSKKKYRKIFKRTRIGSFLCTIQLKINIYLTIQI